MRPPRPASLLPAAALSGVALLVAGCGGQDTPRRTPSAAPPGATVEIGPIGTSLDPALAKSDGARMLAAATQTPLLTYRRTMGDGAADLVPALAAAMPSLSPDRREYRFQLRTGLLYADGRLVKASDVERSIAHASSSAASPELRAALRSIVGAPATGTTLSGVRTDDRTGIVAVRLRRPDGRVPLALADPATAPLPELAAGSEAPASTGPLRIVRRAPGTIELASNPLRPTIDAVPASHLARITVVDGTAASQRARQVRADVNLLFDGLVAGPAADRMRVRAPSLSTVAAYLPERGLTQSRAVRRALAAAVDVRAEVGSDGPLALCGVLPRPVVGSSDHAPCPQAPSTGRRVLRGAQVRIATLAGGITPSAVRRAIRALGGTSTTTQTADPLRAVKEGRADIAITTLSPVLPHPAGWLGPAAPLDPLLTREVPRLTHAPLTGAQTRWADLDRRALDRAVVIPLLQLQDWAIISTRIDRRSVQLHPVLGLQLAALQLSDAGR